MPCATIHLLTAGRALAEVPAGGLPFPADDPDHRSAFLHGALAPDMGFIPGTERWVSELSHYVRTGDLTRVLLRRASDLREAAFAWGWATHVVTDLELHPRVGHACGERATGDRSVRLNAADDLPAHVGTEVGLDLHFLSREPGIPRPPARPAFDARTIEYLAGALEETYGIPFHRGRLLDTHRRAVSMTARWPRALQVLEWGRGVAGEAARGVRGWIGRAAAGTGARMARPGGAAEGFFRPLRPPAWLVEEVEALASDFPRRMSELAAGGMERLGNHNLETGAPDDAPVPHRDAERTARRLDLLRSGVAAPLPDPGAAPG